MNTRAVTQSGTLPYPRLLVGAGLKWFRYSRVELRVTTGKILVLTSIFLVATFLCGCSSGPEWARRTYSFSPVADASPTNAPTNTVALSRVGVSPLFQSRSFTYRIAENSYEQDPYAGFLISPERALGEAIRESMRAGGGFGRVVEPGCSLVPNIVAEVFISKLYGDFRNPSQPTAKLELHFLCYEFKEGSPGRVVLDKVYARETPLKAKAPGDLMAAWDTALREIMEEVKSEYARSNSTQY